MLLHIQSSILQSRVLTVAGGKEIQETAKRKRVLQIKSFLYVYHSDKFIIIFFSVCRYSLSSLLIHASHALSVKCSLYVGLVLQVGKRHSLWLLSYLNISLAMGTYFSKSMRKQLGIFVCSFSIPLNSLFFLFFLKKRSYDHLLL